MSAESAEGHKPIGWKPIALDGGYGWVVVLGSFLIHVFADGFVYSFGVIADPILKDFSASNAAVSTILALLTGLMMAVGPVASAICNRFGCRVTTIIGAVIASIGCVLSSFATSIVHLIFSTGIVMGIGFGFMYCPAIVIVTMYFEKHRSLATGVTVCGAGVGTLVFPKILGLLLEIFDKEEAWRRVFQIYSGVVLLCVPCAALFKPVKVLPIYQRTIEDDSEDTESYALISKIEEETSLFQNSVINSPCDKKFDYKYLDNEINPEEKPFLQTKETDLSKPVDTLPQRSISLGDYQVSSSSTQKKRPNLSESNVVDFPKKKDSKSKKKGYLNVTDCFYRRSVTHIPAYNKDPQKFRLVKSEAASSSKSKKNADKKKFDEAIDVLDQEAVKDNSSLESNSIKTIESISIWGTIKKMMDLSLFTKPVFVIFVVANFLMSIGFDPPPMFMPMYAHHKGWTLSQATTTVSIYGFANIIGRMTFGLVCDCKLPFSWGKNLARNRMCIFSISMILCGISCCLVFWMDVFWLFGVYCFFFAFSVSSFVCLPSVVLVDLVGVERLTNAFGLLLFIQGIATFIGPPVAGELFDVTQQYYWSFAFCGITLLLGGALLIVILGVQHFSLKRDAVLARCNEGLEEEAA